MLRSDRFYTSSSSLIAGVLLLLIGSLMIIGQDQLYFDVVELFLIVNLCLGIIQFLRYFLLKQKRIERKLTFTRSFFHLIFCLFFSFFPKIPMSIVPIFFAFYLILNGMIKSITYVLLLTNKSYGRIKELFLAIVYFIVAIPLLFSPLKNVSTMLVIIGVYILLLGFNFIIDFVSSLISRKTKNKIKRRFRVTLPVILDAIIPYQVLNEINYFIDKEEYSSLSKNCRYHNSEFDMEIFVHVSMRGFNRLGHVDICFDDRVISYGNYDDSSVTFFRTVGDGVVFVTNKEKYIPFCVEHSQKTIFGFGIKLTDLQKREIRKYIDQLFSNMYEWNPPIVSAKKCDQKNESLQFKDYASCLYQATKASFYKFKSGKFKKYFALGVNCCLLADSIIGKSGSDILKMNGLITPGTYYEYLNREFQKKNSNVVFKNIYNKENL